VGNIHCYTPGYASLGGYNTPLYTRVCLPGGIIPLYTRVCLPGSIPLYTRVCLSGGVPLCTQVCLPVCDRQQRGAYYRPTFGKDGNDARTTGPPLGECWQQRGAYYRPTFGRNVHNEARTTGPPLGERRRLCGEERLPR